MASNIRRVRGIFERPKGSGVWWIRYADAAGRIRREKVGLKKAAINLYQKRKLDALTGRKLPEKLRRRGVLVAELLADAAQSVRLRYRGQRLGADGNDYRYRTLREALGSCPADSLTPRDIERALTNLADERGWKPASFNRHKAFLSLAYRLGIENGKVQSNPVRLVHRRREDNGRVRFLSEKEEARLRAVIENDYPGELPAFDLALHTGMRRSEQYSLTWDCVDLARRQITIPRSKNSERRYIPLNDTAMCALLALRSRSNGSGRVMLLAKSGHGYRAGHALACPREWFQAACKKAGIPDFTWHCLRHTFASRLVMAGVGLRTVQELMGHKTIAMTCRYAHLGAEHQLAAVGKLDGWEPNFRCATGTTTSTGTFETSDLDAVKHSHVVVQ